MSDITAEQLRRLKNLARRVKRNTPIIEARLRAAGVKPDPAFVFAAASYWQCLNRLASDTRREAKKLVFKNNLK